MPPPVRLVDPPPAEAEEPRDEKRPAPIAPDEEAEDDAAEDELLPLPAAGAADARTSPNIRPAVVTKACMDRPIALRICLKMRG